MTLAVWLVAFILNATVPAQSPSPSPITVQVQAPRKDVTDYLVATAQIAALIGLIKIFWTRVYAGHFERPVTLYVEDLQSRLAIISSQLALIAASAPGSIDADLVHSLIDLTVKLAQLSQWQFRMDGGESYRKFNAAGDEILPTVDDVIAKLAAKDRKKAAETNGQ